MFERREPSQLLKDFTVMAKNQFRANVKVVRINNGSELTFRPMQKFYRGHEILCQSSYNETPQQNGRVKHKHMHVLNVARALFLQASLPVKF